MVIHVDRDRNFMVEEHGTNRLVTDYPPKKRILQEVTHDDAPDYEGEVEIYEKPLVSVILFVAS